jgi:hypothetical protein
VRSDNGLLEAVPQIFRLDLKYLGASRLELRGSSTGELYRFSSEVRVQPVDLRDARYMLVSPLFTVA